MGESAIDRDIGPPIETAANKNYRAIKEVCLVKFAIHYIMHMHCIFHDLPLHWNFNKDLKLLKQILSRMKSLCFGREGKPRKHEQRLLRNLGAHNVVLQLLQIPYDKVSIF